MEKEVVRCCLLAVVWQDTKHKEYVPVYTVVSLKELMADPEFERPCRVLGGVIVDPADIGVISAKDYIEMTGYYLDVPTVKNKKYRRYVDMYVKQEYGGGIE